MKLNRIIAAASAVVLAAVSMVSCGKKEKVNYSSDNIQSTNIQPAPPKENYEDVKPAADGPRLKIKDTTAKAGETAAVTIQIENAEMKWNMCGFHIVYPDTLKPEMMNEEERLVKKNVGSASEYNAGNVCMEWRENLDKYLVDNKLGSIFFTETFEADYGLDGDVFTFYLKIPENAVSGTEYPVDFYYHDGAVFSNAAGDLSMQKYVFENWQGGKITVE